MNSIEAVIKKLGYSGSKSIYRIGEVAECKELSYHDRSVIIELKPYAVYIADGKPFVLFFEDLCQRNATSFYKKLWNSQIPVIISDEGDRIAIYNGKALDIDHEDHLSLNCLNLFSIRDCNDENDFSYWNIQNVFTSGKYVGVTDRKGLNHYLLENIRYITSKLEGECGAAYANRLILRVILIRYMIDRGISIGYDGLNEDAEHSKKIFLDIIKDRERFLELLIYLKRKFNGNIFELDQGEEYSISNSALNMLHSFLTGDEDLETGQLCLFPFYDFNIISIETISNIYEILLGKDKRDKDKAFYTPESLADIIVNETVVKKLNSTDSVKVLDPSCGSGVFLVKSLRILLDRQVDKDGYISDIDMLNKLVIDSIFGVDINEEAVDVTIFSLYITLFDYQNPKSLEAFRLPELKNKNIIYGDFFEEKVDAIVRRNNYDCIIGNPPWGSSSQKAYMEYCKTQKMVPQDRELSVAFLLKTMNIGSENTTCSFVIPSKILYKKKKPSVLFRKTMLSKTEIIQIIELAAVRKQIFKGAIAPAAVFSFACHHPSDGHKFEYISVKPNDYMKAYGVIMIEPGDIKYAYQEMILKNDHLWKILAYGTYWDFLLINDILKRCDSFSKIADESNLIMRKGIQTNKGDAKDSSALVGKRILKSKNVIDHFSLDDNAYDIFELTKIHRPPNEISIFSAPYVLYKKGLDINDYTIKAVYSEKDFLYREAISCVKGGYEQKNVLLNICGIMNSSMFAYFNLMLGSSAGIEREQIFLDEIRSYPYVYSDKLVELVEKALAEQGNSTKEELYDKINECVMEMYGVKDNIFVDYALNVQVPLLCGKYNDVKCDTEIIDEYIDVFSQKWDDHFSGSGISCSYHAYLDVKGNYVAIRVNLSNNDCGHNSKIIEDKYEIPTEIDKVMFYKMTDNFFCQKNIVEYDKDSFCIIKTNKKRNWHSAMAIKDCSNIINSLLLRKDTNN